MFTYITFPADYTTSTLALAGNLFTDFLPLINTVIPIILVVAAVVVLFGVFFKH